MRKSSLLGEEEERSEGVGRVLEKMLDEWEVSELAFERVIVIVSVR